MVNILETGPGKNFSESEELIRNNLKYAGFDEILLLETKTWTSNKGKKFVLEKE